MKRDRAAEALLLTGSKFVVNIIAEGAEKVRLAHAFDATSQDACMLLFVQNPPAALVWKSVTRSGICFAHAEVIALSWVALLFKCGFAQFVDC